MNATGEQKKMLIESMKKLVSHVSNNPQRQRQIFDALSLQDLNKIIQNLRDQNEYLRRISALLLCELFYQNTHTKQGAIKMLEIEPAQGRICLSGIPDSIHKYPSTLKKCLELMQTPVAEEQEQKMCWLVNLQRKSLKIQTMEYKKYSSFTFIDPMKHLFGFTISTGKKISPSPKHSLTAQKSPNIVKKQVDSVRVKKTLYNDTSRNQPERIRVPLQSPKQTYKPASNLYKKFMDHQPHSKQVRRYSYGLNNSLQNREQLPVDRALNPRYGDALATNKNQSIRNSIEVRTGPGSGAQTSRSSYGQQRQRPTQNGYMGGHNTSLNFTGKSANPTDFYFLHQFEQGRKDTHNDRKMISTVKERISMANTTQAIGQKSMRVSVGVTGKEVSSEHEKFYRRVKEILRK